VQFALQAKQYVTFAAPMVCDLARSVFDHANPNGAEMLCAPVRSATVALVRSSIDARPIGGAKRNARHVHEISLSLSFLPKRLVLLLLNSVR
jgi:hypothetical protein